MTRTTLSSPDGTSLSLSLELAVGGARGGTAA